ncbi:MAG TPA: hypothetical protein VKM55_15460 [Candidatus Lokiarchaeia archaeon]|nr:hypothetical protein [Candidatus Lokiarchaeia archaeon]
MEILNHFDDETYVEDKVKANFISRAISPHPYSGDLWNAKI